LAQKDVETAWTENEFDKDQMCDCGKLCSKHTEAEADECLEVYFNPYD